MLVGLVASGAPMRRTTRVDPNVGAPGRSEGAGAGSMRRDATPSSAVLAVFDDGADGSFDIAESGVVVRRWTFPTSGAAGGGDDGDGDDDDDVVAVHGSAADVSTLGGGTRTGIRRAGNATGPDADGAASADPALPGAAPRPVAVVVAATDRLPVDELEPADAVEGDAKGAVGVVAAGRAIGAADPGGGVAGT